MANNQSKQVDLRQPEEKKIISWLAPKFFHYPRGLSWYLGIIVIAAGLAAFFIWQKEYLSSVVIILAALILFLLAGEKPPLIKYTLSKEGLGIGEEIYPFENFKSFWLVEGVLVSTLHFETTSRIFSYSTIYLTKVNHQEVREFLKKYLPEKEGGKNPLHEQVSRWFRF